MVDDPELKSMLVTFDSMPQVLAPDGGYIDLDEAAARGILKHGWLRGGWDGKGLWPVDAEPVRVLRQQFGEFFGSSYDHIIEQREAADHVE